MSLLTMKAPPPAPRLEGPPPTPIHQIWIQGHAQMPERYGAGCERWRDMCWDSRGTRLPFRYEFWDGPRIARLVGRHMGADARIAFEDLAGAPVVQADHGRVAIMWAEGGFYMDADTDPVRLPNAAEVEEARRRPMLPRCIPPCALPFMRRLVQPLMGHSNYALAGPPRHPFWRECLVVGGLWKGGTAPLTPSTGPRGKLKGGMGGQGGRKPPLGGSRWIPDTHPSKMRPFYDAAVAAGTVGVFDLDAFMTGQQKPTGGTIAFHGHAAHWLPHKGASAAMRGIRNAPLDIVLFVALGVVLIALAAWRFSRGNAVPPDPLLEGGGKGDGV